MTLRLQPFFVDMHTVEAPDALCGEGTSLEKITATRPDSGDAAAAVLSPTTAPPTSQAFPTEASKDSLYSMWKVATKVKSVMVDGARFENLTWRAWHRKNQLERVERERRTSSTGGSASNGLSLGGLTLARAEGGLGDPSGGGPEKAAVLPRGDGGGGGACLLPAQATAIPRSGSFGRSVVYNQGYSSILAEIQAAGARKGPSEPSRLSVTSPVPVGSLLLSTPSDLRGPVGSDTTVPTLSIECASAAVPAAHHLQEAYHQTDSLHLAYSGGSASSQDSARSSSTHAPHRPSHMPGVPAGRRRKKNVDRFIKRHLNQPPHLLDVIAETLDEPTKAGGGEVQPPTNEVNLLTLGSGPAATSESNSPSPFKAREKVDAGEKSGTSPSTIPLRSPQDDSSIPGWTTTKNVDTLICSPPTGKGSSSGGISLLTLLLNRGSVESRRPTIDQQAQAPSLAAASPPSRPEAPHPPLAPDGGGQRAVASSKSPVIVPLPVPVPSDLVEASPCASLASQVATDSSSAEHLSEGHSSSAVGSSSTASQGPRRRTGLPPPEFTAPLYIW